MNKEVEVKMKVDEYKGSEIPKYSHNEDDCLDIKCAEINSISE